MGLKSGMFTEVAVASLGERLAGTGIALCVFFCTIWDNSLIISCCCSSSCPKCFSLPIASSTCNKVCNYVHKI